MRVLDINFLRKSALLISFFPEPNTAPGKAQKEHVICFAILVKELCILRVGAENGMLKVIR